MAVNPNTLKADIVANIEADTGNTQIPAAQIVWLAVSKAIAPYFTGAGGGVNQVTAGSSKVIVSPTTGNVVVDVVPSNFTGIPESAVTGLVSDLSTLAASISAKAPATRMIATTAPLTGGGDLSADRTLGVNTFGAAQSGVVPASGGGTQNWLRADGAWATLPMTDGWFGVGSDGALVFDGTSTVLGLVPSAGVYTMTRDITAVDVTVNAGVTIRTNGYRGFVTGTTTNLGLIHNNGTNGAAGVAGAAVGGTVTGQGTAAGGNGTTGQAGTASTACIPIWPSSSAANGGAVGGTTTAGGNGTAGTQGRGGGGGGAAISGVGGGGSGGTVTPVAAAAGGLTIWQLVNARPLNATTAYNAGSGGGGASANASAGAGGGGAGFLVWMTRVLAGTGSFQAIGGNGGNGVAGSGGGGGGGGGGGVIVLGYMNRTGSITTSAAGGAGGTGAVNGSGFAGGNGGAGGAGSIFLFNLSGNGT